MVCPGKINTSISLNAVNALGEKHGVMNHNLETGMPVEECVGQILEAQWKKRATRSADRWKRNQSGSTEKILSKVVL